jgi:hypothetical protein
MAAWRSGGILVLPFKSALPAAVAPNRSLYAGILSLIRDVFIFRDIMLSRQTLKNHEIVM